VAELQTVVERVLHSDAPQNIYTDFWWWTKHCRSAM